MSADIRVAAVDLGGTSGRVMAADIGPRSLSIEEVHRFDNGPVRLATGTGTGTGSTLYWDVLSLYRETLAGIAAARGGGDVAGIGIDSWGVDYGLLDADGALLGNPVHHRDSRNDGIAARVRTTVSDQELYDVTGLQQLPFNTLYQLVSERDTARFRAADRLLLIPDLLAYWLTGSVGVERTVASTTQLYDVRAGVWATGIAERLDIPPRLLPPLRTTGDVIGTVLPDVVAENGLPECPVVAVGSHDTASALVGTPAEPGTNFAFISSGTWSLVGVELDEPVLTCAAREANFTNETGVDGAIRFLRNVMGLWVLSETLRTWRVNGSLVELTDVLAKAAIEPGLRAVVDVNAPEFLPPGDMPARIAAACRATSQAPPDTAAATVRCILDSLALAYRRTIRQAAKLSGRPVDVVHVVGGGTRNELLCQLTADACGVPVVAGPGEAAALGNALVQARTLGANLSDVAAMRALVRATHDVRRYEPAGSRAAWDDAEACVYE